MRLPDINDLIADLRTAKQIAIDDRNPNAIVTATMSQAKLLGLDKGVIHDEVELQPVTFIIQAVDARKPERVS